MQTASPLFDLGWQELLSAFPASLDLTSSARSSGALRRRRGISDGAALLRMALAYGPGGMSLRQAAAWASVAGVADISDVAVMKRLRGCAPWLEHLCGEVLAQRVEDPGLYWHGRAIRIADATCISRPGSTGTDWRLHVGFDLATRGFEQCVLTDVRGGESLQRLAVSPGEVWLADRNYGWARDLRHLAAHEADFVIRIGWRAVRLRHADGSPFDLLAALGRLAAEETGEWQVFLADGADPALPVRIVARRKPGDATERERHKIVAKAAKRRTGRADPRSLIAAEFIVLATSLADVPADAVLSLYRLRWQVEMAFKRLKSLMHIDRLPAKDPALARSWLYAHVLAALLIDQQAREFLDSPPCTDDNPYTLAVAGPEDADGCAAGCNPGHPESQGAH